MLGRHSGTHTGQTAHSLYLPQGVVASGQNSHPSEQQYAGVCFFPPAEDPFFEEGEAEAAVSAVEETFRRRRGVLGG